MLINHVDLRGTVRPGGFGAVLICELIAVSERAGRWQMAGHHGRTATDDKRRRR